MDSNYANMSPEMLQTFVSGLHKSSGTAEGFQKITAMLFEVVAARQESEEDRRSILWLQQLIEAMQTQVLQPIPKVRECLFFPDEENEERLIHWIKQAKTELLICVFTITNNGLRNAVRHAHQQGINVRVISDDECMKQQGSDVQYLRDAGIPTEIDTNPNAHMHNKFVVIDKSIIITGSFNWTQSAVHANQENLLVLYDPVVCEQYIDYFNELWGVFRPVEASNFPSGGSHRNRRR